ncbi:MAG TPA: gliding motility lipoprotein GldH [Chitinophagaceae bacterium]|nr:gliding motility lipoprotein GldH [Chitinophagaceae bacterium]
MKNILVFILSAFLLSSCIQTGLFEKNVTLKNHAWSNTYKPTISFEITDTISAYNVFFVVRHTDAFSYNNLWVKIRSKGPGDSASTAQQFDLPLANQNKWTGTGMDDIFEHRILLSRRPLRFPRAGSYEFTLEHVMRENPLNEVLNVGIRLEKTGQQ